MPDFLSPAERSARMARVGPKGNEPELRVSRLMHRLRCRHRLHRRNLTGKPDLAFPGSRKVAFVNGCFWQGHQGCSRASCPEVRHEFWASKIDGNAARYIHNHVALTVQGWYVPTIWRCEVRKMATLANLLQTFRGTTRIEATEPEHSGSQTFFYCNSIVALAARTKCGGGFTGAGT